MKMFVFRITSQVSVSFYKIYKPISLTFSFQETAVRGN